MKCAKILSSYYTLFLLSLMFTSCDGSGVLEFNNPELSIRKNGLVGINEASLEKYSIEGVIIEPLIWFKHETVSNPVTTYHFGIIFYSKSTNKKVSISSIDIQLKGEKIAYGKNIINKSIADWKPFPTFPQLFFCSVEGNAIDRSVSDLYETSINVSIIINVETETGKFIQKKIDSNFFPKERSKFMIW